MKKSIVICILFSTCLFSDILYMDDLIKEALQKSPDIAISKARFEAAQQRSKQADSYYLPQLDLRADGGQQNTNYADQKIGITPNEFEPGDIKTTLLSGKISAKQLVYDFGKTGGNIDFFSDQADASEFAMQQTISDKVFRVKKLYFELLTQHALIQVYEENVNLNEQQLIRAQRYFDAGIRTKVDVTDAQVNLIEAKIALQNSTYDTKLALTNLYKEIGLDIYGNKYEVYIQRPERENVYESLDKALENDTYYQQKAFENRAELQASEAYVNASHSKQESMRGDYYPAMYLNGEYLAQSVDKDAFAPEQQWRATLSLQWNLFSGNNTTARYEEARLELVQAEAELKDTRLKIQKEVSDAYIHVHKELENIKLSESLSLASKQKFIQSQKRYEYGLADYIELQQSRQSYIDALGRLMQGYYRFHIALAELDRAAGLI